jgi:hypothetical protein
LPSTGRLDGEPAAEMLSLGRGDCGESGVLLLTCSEEIDLMSESFAAFRDQYLRRHENPVNGALHTVADVVELGSLVAGVVTRRIRVGVIGYTVAFAIGTVGHLFFNRGPCETT